MASDQDYRQLWRHTLLRLLLTYLAPLLLLTVYFHLQSGALLKASRRTHLVAIAENQASTLDLFLRERVVNLINVVDDPNLPLPPDPETMQRLLARLQRDSDTFVDLGFFEPQGTMVSYAGPYLTLLGRNYGGEPWFANLHEREQRFVITDMYLGFRERPHFTIAVRRDASEGAAILRATLDPARFRDYLSTLRGSGEVTSVLVNGDGRYQVVDLPEGLPPDGGVRPPRDPVLGTAPLETGRHREDYAYCWLQQTDWALVVLHTGAGNGHTFADIPLAFFALSAALILAVFSAIVIRTRKVVEHQRAEDNARAELSGQLHHAARLASVGELAAGVAHEINNPLAVIAEEVGLVRDLMDPRFGQELGRDELKVHLESIHTAVFRARDITRKLLSFVRRGEVRLEWQNVHDLLDDVVAGFLEREMTTSNIEFVRDYLPGLPPILTDRSQLEQVVVNLLTNAIDAIQGPGRIGITTSLDDTGDAVRIAVTDTGCGIPSEHLEKIFMPFHTTKEVGKGTGLGLSVSYSIVKSFGGSVAVSSRVGEGTTFTLTLPIRPPSDGSSAPGSPERSP